MPTGDIRKAAILLMSLPDEQAAQLLAKLDAKQVEAVSIEIAKIGGVTGDEQEIVIQDFANANPDTLTGRPAGWRWPRTSSSGPWARAPATTLDNVRQSIEALPFGFLQKVDSQNLLTFIIDEHPQTIALILCHLPPRRRPRSSAGCPPSGRLSVDPPHRHHGPDQPGDHQGGRERGWNTACRA